MALRGPIGVLAVQGDFREHRAHLSRLGVETRSIRRPADLPGISGLVIPGGESTVIDKLTRQFEVALPIRTLIANGLPVYGTCAGLIMIADRVQDAIAGQQNFGGLDATVRRNAFGGQTESFEEDLDFAPVTGAPVHAVFIRAPLIESVGPGVEVLARLADGRIVAAQQGNLLGTSFHPEITGDLRVHKYFVSLCEAAGVAA